MSRDKRRARMSGQEYILVEEFSKREFDDNLAPLYSRALVGMTVQVGGWWIDVGKPRIDVVAAHLVNVAWNGLSKLDAAPGLATIQEAKKSSKKYGQATGSSSRRSPLG